MNRRRKTSRRLAGGGLLLGLLTIAITPTQWRQEELPLDRVARVQQCGDAEHE